MTLFGLGVTVHVTVADYAEPMKARAGGGVSERAGGRGLGERANGADGGWRESGVRGGAAGSELEPRVQA